MAIADVPREPFISRSEPENYDQFVVDVDTCLQSTVSLPTIRTTGTWISCAFSDFFQAYFHL